MKRQYTLTINLLLRYISSLITLIWLPQSPQKVKSPMQQYQLRLEKKIKQLIKDL